MSVPKEHDYMGVSEASSMERSCDVLLNLKETELRLGLPGSVSPERKSATGVCIFGKDLEDKSADFTPLKGFNLGAKRGFSDAIDNTSSGKWGFSSNGRSEADWDNRDEFSPRGVNGGPKQACLKEAGPDLPLKPLEVKKSTPANDNGDPHASKAQVVGWPPIRAFRKNTLATSSLKNSNTEGKSGSDHLYVKVSMDGAPYLRKVDIKTYTNYAELSSALEKMFSCFTIGQCTSDGLTRGEGLSESHLMNLLNGSEYVLTYEDKDGDWMLVGDVPWEMFTESCKRLRVMKSSEAIGLAPRAINKCKNQVSA